MDKEIGDGVRTSVATEAGVSRRRLLGAWRLARSSSLITRQACSGMVWSPQVDASAAGVLRPGVDRDVGFGQQSQPVTPRFKPVGDELRKWHQHALQRS